MFISYEQLKECNKNNKLAIIDNELYYDIFSVDNTTYTHPLNRVINCCLTDNEIKHIIITRRVYNLDSRFLIIIAGKLRNYFEIA